MMGRRAVLDWHSISKDYITGIVEGGTVRFPSLAMLAQKYNCALDTLKQKCSAEKWLQQRQAFQEEVQKQMMEHTLNERLLTAKELDGMVEKTATALLSQMFDLVVEEQTLDPKERTAIKLSRHLLEIQKAARIALGLPTEAVRTETSVSVGDELKALEEALQAVSTEDLKKLLADEDEEEV